MNEVIVLDQSVMKLLCPTDTCVAVTAKLLITDLEDAHGLPGIRRLQQLSIERNGLTRHCLREKALVSKRLQSP